MSTTVPSQVITAEVRCISKNPRDDRHRRILGIGGVNDGGSRWWLNEDTAIADIEAGTHRFWTTTPDGKRSVWVIVAHNGIRKYLKTEADGVEPNNLLALPECSGQR